MRQRMPQTRGPTELYWRYRVVDELRFIDREKSQAIHLSCGKKVQVKGLVARPVKRNPYVRLWCPACEIEICLTISMFDRIGRVEAVAL